MSDCQSQCILCKRSLNPNQNIERPSPSTDYEIYIPETKWEDHQKLFRIYCSLLKLNHHDHYTNFNFNFSKTEPLFCTKCLLEVQSLSALYDDLVSTQIKIEKGLRRTLVSMLESLDKSQAPEGVKIEGMTEELNSRESAVATFRELATREYMPRVKVSRYDTQALLGNSIQDYPDIGPDFIVNIKQEKMDFEPEDGSLNLDEIMQSTVFENNLECSVEDSSIRDSSSNSLDNEAEDAASEINDPPNLTLISPENSRIIATKCQPLPTMSQLLRSNKPLLLTSVNSQDNTKEKSDTTSKRSRTSNKAKFSSFPQADGRIFCGFVAGTARIEVLKTGDDQIYKCSRCSKNMKTLPNIMDHIKRVHFGISQQQRPFSGIKKRIMSLKISPAPNDKDMNKALPHSSNPQENTRTDLKPKVEPS